MHGPINVKSPNNTSKWQIGFNSAFKGLNIVILHLSAYEDGSECSETSAYKIQTPGNYPEKSMQQYRIA